MGMDSPNGHVCAPVRLQRTHRAGGHLDLWLESSLRRVYPASPAGTSSSLRLVSARNAQISFQACFRNESSRAATVTCNVNGPTQLQSCVRRVGYVPMWNHTAQVPTSDLDGLGFTPGLVPDPLFPDPQATCGPWASQPFWITVRVPPDIPPGRHELTVTMKPADQATSATLDVQVDVRPLVIRQLRDFPVTHWWNPDCIADYYKVPLFGDDWYRLTANYLENMVQHGCNVIFVPLFHHRREIALRPTQLLKVRRAANQHYSFDWSDVHRFVALARKCGFTEFEWPHLWQMLIRPDGYTLGAAEPQRIYLDGKGPRKLVVPADYPATGTKYVAFLEQFLPEFEQFLKEERLLKKSWFHVSDEPGGTPQDIQNYRAARDLLARLAPWTDGRVIDAMSDVRYGKLKLIDYPIPNVAAAADYMAAGLPHWVYYCCGPRGACLNRFFDTPLAKIRMSGWLFYRHRARGFLHWGYNFWYVMDLGFNATPQVLIDPFIDGAAGCSAGGEGEPYGDSFVVYPGADGPIDSIRWEVFAESLQDYAILQSAGIAPDDPMLAPLHDYSDFPKSQEWLDIARQRVLNAGD